MIGLAQLVFGHCLCRLRLVIALWFHGISSKKVGFGEEDGEEFDQVKVALVPVVELDVPDEFGVSGHVVVSDHAAVPLAAELHPDVSSD